jgi:hypothetical protein
MSDIKLTCAETPLYWPSNVALESIEVCGSCGIKVTTPNPGTLKLMTRRQGSGVGDGVNVEEDFFLANADYRGQKYAIKEAIFHTPGLHIFPGQTAIYPAEYHIHMETLSSPHRYVTLAIPVSHLVSEDPVTRAYFAAMRQTPKATDTRPTLEKLLSVLESPILQYQGPDLRGRIYDTSGAPMCNEKGERQFLLLLKPASIRASDLERIPREGSLSIDPRDLPAPGAEPKVKAISFDRLRKTMMLAKPGLLYAKPVEKTADGPQLRLLDGTEIVDISGTPVTLKSLLGAESNTPPTVIQSPGSQTMGARIVMGLAMLAGFLFFDYLATEYVWPICIEASPALKGWSIYKWLFVLLIFLPVFFVSPEMLFIS